MAWTVVDGCYGCGRCTFCAGIEMDSSSGLAKIIDEKSDCIIQMAEICPAGVIQLK